VEKQKNQRSVFAGIHAKSRENMGWRAIDGCSGTVQEGKKKKE